MAEPESFEELQSDKEPERLSDSELLEVFEGGPNPIDGRGANDGSDYPDDPVSYFSGRTHAEGVKAYNDYLLHKRGR